MIDRPIVVNGLDHKIINRVGNEICDRDGGLPGGAVIGGGVNPLLQSKAKIVADDGGGVGRRIPGQCHLGLRPHQQRADEQGRRYGQK